MHFASRLIQHRKVHLQQSTFTNRDQSANATTAGASAPYPTVPIESLALAANALPNARGYVNLLPLNPQFKQCGVLYRGLRSAKVVNADNANGELLWQDE